MKNILRTKIIATIGPACNSTEKITALIKAGTRAFRVNSSHGDKDSHLEEINNIRAACKALNIYIPIILDLQGPKIRAGILREPMNLVEGQVVVLQPAKEQGDNDFIPVDYPDLFKCLKKDETILMDDGKIQLKILSATAEKIEAEVTDGGILNSRKGINIPGSSINIPSLSEKDIDYIKFAVDNNIDYIAQSFVRKKDDIALAKKYISQFGGNIPVISKIEKPEAVDNLNEIMDISDAIMVARGDLGIELSPERVPIVQKHIIRQANLLKKEVIVATQMLESMIHEPIPTRAEASDVANAIIDGTDAVMLSGETAVGEYPAEAVGIMASIAENIENSDLSSYNTSEFLPGDFSVSDTQIIANAAIKMLEQTKVEAVVVFTKTGFTARLVSKARPSVPVVAISDNLTVCNQLNLLWGVLPVYMEFNRKFSEEFLYILDELLLKNTFLQKGNKIVITAGMPIMEAGSTNFVRIHQIL